MKEFTELSNYPLFYEEIGPKKQPKSQKSSGEPDSQNARPSLSEQQISLLTQDMQHPLGNSTNRTTSQ